MKAPIKQMGNEPSDFRQISGNKALVVGGAGFIGSWLCEALVDGGASVVCLDDFSTGRKENLSQLADRITVVQEDASSEILSLHFDYIFYLASRASTEDFTRHPIETLRSSSIGLWRTLEAAKRFGSKVFFASTSEIYGDARIVPTPETYYGNVNPVGVRSGYDEGKRFGEASCMAYYREYQVDVRIARIFNTYGPRIRDDGAYARALPRFLSQALKNEPITIHGDGSQTRSFCYVSDTVRGILGLASMPNLEGEVINIGHQNEISMLDLAKKIKETTRSSSEFVFLSSLEDDPKRRCPDISKAKRLLDWEPRIGLSLGLETMVKSYVPSRFGK